VVFSKLKLKNPADKTKILFLGASITQGKISVSFVHVLKKALGNKKYEYINQAVAGYESYNVLGKIEKASNVKPNYVIILVGTNDVLSSLDPKLEKLTRKLKHIPHPASLSHFSNNITNIIKKLKEKITYKIALSSLPVIGENLNSPENKTLIKYNNELKNIAEIEQVSYLPVFEKQRDYLIKIIDGKGKDYKKSSKQAFKSLFMHYFFFMKLDTISEKNGYFLLTDGVHQNTKGATIIADEIKLFLKQEEFKN
jgi:lysophospholipase L1-like esterase